MERRKSVFKIKNKSNFTKESFSYDILYYNFLYEYAEGKIQMKDPKLLIIKPDRYNKTYPPLSNWFRIYTEINVNKIFIKGEEIPILGYNYIFQKSKIKYKELLKESLKINRPVLDIVRVYVQTCKQGRVNLTFQNSFFGKMLEAGTERRGTLQKVHILIPNIKIITNKVLGINGDQEAQINEIEKSKSQIMKKHQDIHVKIKDVPVIRQRMGCKKIIFKGKYCQTYILEDDEILMRNNSMKKIIRESSIGTKNVHLNNSNANKNFHRRKSFKLSTYTGQAQNNSNLMDISDNKKLKKNHSQPLFDLKRKTIKKTGSNLSIMREVSCNSGNYGGENFHKLPNLSRQKSDYLAPSLTNDSLIGVVPNSTDLINNPSIPIKSLKEDKSSINLNNQKSFLKLENKFGLRTSIDSKLLDRGTLKRITFEGVLHNDSQFEASKEYKKKSSNNLIAINKYYHPKISPKRTTIQYLEKNDFYFENK